MERTKRSEAGCWRQVRGAADSDSSDLVGNKRRGRTLANSHSSMAAVASGSRIVDGKQNSVSDSAFRPAGNRTRQGFGKDHIAPVMTLYTGKHAAHSGMIAIECAAIRHELPAEAPGKWDYLHASKWC